MTRTKDPIKTVVGVTTWGWGVLIALASCGLDQNTSPGHALGSSHEAFVQSFVGDVENNPEDFEDDLEDLQEVTFGPDGLSDLKPATTNMFALKWEDGCNVRVLVQNIGSGPAGPSVARLTWHTQNDGTPVEVFVNVPAVPAGSSVWSDVIPGIKLFSNSITGLVPFQITVDVLGEVSESNEANNMKKFAWPIDEGKAFVPKACTAFPDLTIKSLDWTADCKLNVAIENIGEADTGPPGAGGFMLRVSGLTSDHTNNLPMLKKGQMTVYAIDGLKALTADTPTLAHADWNGSSSGSGWIGESDESNNTLSTLPPVQCVGPTPPPTPESSYYVPTETCMGLYAIHHNESGGEYLSKINPDTGELIYEVKVSDLYDTNISITCLMNQMYMRMKNKLYTVDVLSGAKSFVAEMPNNDLNHIGASGTQLIVANVNAGSAYNMTIRLFDPATQQFTAEFPQGPHAFNDVAGSLNGISYGIGPTVGSGDEANLLRIDTQTQTVTKIGTLEDKHYRGFEFGLIQGSAQYIGAEEAFGNYRTIAFLPISEAMVFTSLHIHDLAWGWAETTPLP